MKTSLAVVLFSLSLPILAGAQAKPATTAAPAPATAAVKYGANAAAGRTFTHDGVKLYYEVYGAGEPLLVVHGNGGSISDLRGQIAHFRKRYMVIAMDSRDHGRSADSADTLTYEKMTDDLAALLEHLKVGPGERARLERRWHRGTAPRDPPPGQGEEAGRDGRQPESERGRLQP